MATLPPQPPYTPAELARLYPPHLRLEQVQIVLRHGERTPVSARFQNAGLQPWWPLCQHAERFKDTVLANTGTAGPRWHTMAFRRVTETTASDGTPTAARGRDGEIDGICHPGELTTKGRETTLALGRRLRELYVDQLGFLPDVLSDANTVALRATPIQRALESVQQTFYGLYPPPRIAATCPVPTVVTRAMGEETLFPNTGACRRFAQLFEMFTARAAQRWNQTEEMEYIDGKIGRWMPEGNKRVAVDGKPRLSGVMDTINAMKGHEGVGGLPKEFYDERMAGLIDKIVCDEWYTGFHESKDYRALGIGALVGDLTTRMIWHVERKTHRESTDLANVDASEGDTKIWLAGAHDTTVAGILVSLGAFGNNGWPPFTSHVAVELFSENDDDTKVSDTSNRSSSSLSSSWWSSLLGSKKPDNTSIARTPTSDLTPPTRALLQRHYVRLRYNGVPAIIPGCRRPGRHLEGDESFCTLETFKAIVEGFAPADWRGQCRENLEQKTTPEVVVPAGWPKGEAPEGK